MGVWADRSGRWAVGAGRVAVMWPAILGEPRMRGTGAVLQSAPASACCAW